MGSSKINWPDDLRPEKSPVYTYNELAIAAEPRLVWAWLVRAAWWPKWYPYWIEIKILSGTGPDLAPGTAFTATAPIWKIFNVKIKTIVKDFLPCERLAWRGSSFGVDGYHAWVIEPAAGGCKVITEETQKGWLASLTSTSTEKEIVHRHQVWLEGLAKMSQTGLPQQTQAEKALF